MSRPASPLDMPVSARIWLTKGATLVSATRKLAARSTIPNTRSTRQTRERLRWPGAAVAGAFFVMPRLPGHLPGKAAL